MNWYQKNLDWILRILEDNQVVATFIDPEMTVTGLLYRTRDGHAIKGQATVVGKAARFLGTEYEGVFPIGSKLNPPGRRLVGIEPVPFDSAIRDKNEANSRQIIGFLVGGKFKCLRCAKRWKLDQPDAVFVYLVNVWPYSQQCEECKTLVVDGWKRSGDGGPLSLFDEGIEENHAALKPVDGQSTGLVAPNSAMERL